MSLTSTVADGAQVVTVNAQRIDAAMAIQFKEDMRTETEAGAQRVILDLSSVEFIDSSGLGAIVAAMKQLGKERKLDLAYHSDGRQGVSIDPYGYCFRPLRHASGCFGS